jgi:hypothetical protein
VERIVRDSVDRSHSRFDLWTTFLNATRAHYVAEIGVYRGDFATRILRDCDSVVRYYMIDPWRHLDDWNKPANRSNVDFEGFLSETISRTEFAVEKRVILRGKTTEVVSKISDGELDFAYIDGDHTLKGIAIDLIRIFPKIKMGGVLAGDDFVKTIWQHSTTFEPTLVFPYAIYFAEAVGAHIYALPWNQFLLHKKDHSAFLFTDLVGAYGELSLREHFHPSGIVKLKLKEAFPVFTNVAGILRSGRWKRK